MRRHLVDPISLVFGTLFVVLGALFLSGRVDLADVELKLVGPLLLITMGALIVALAMRNVVRARDEEEEVES